MSLDQDDPQEELPGEGNETSKRSERKRQREKQRRSDLSNAFDELAAFIVQIEPEAGDTDVDMKKKRKRSGAEVGDDSSGITRLDLIGRALRIMKRLHRENEERKRMIDQMRDLERGGRYQNKDNVLVMVPTLSPADEPGPVARASYPPYYQRGGQMPPMPPHPPDYVMPLHGRGPSPSYHHGSHWGSYGRSHPPHPQQGGHPPHPQQGGHPPHPQQGGHPPPHPQQGGHPPPHMPPPPTRSPVSPHGPHPPDGRNHP